MVEGKRDKKDPCRVYEPGPLTHEQADERPQGKQPNRDRKAYHNVCLKAPGCLCVLYNLVAEHDSHVFSFLFLFFVFLNLLRPEKNNTFRGKRKKRREKRKRNGHTHTRRK